VTGARTALVIAIVPLLLAATDPVDDIAPCPSVSGGSATGIADGGAPDLLEARGEIVELGTSIRFTLRFAEPLVVPDDEGRPFRVDIVLLDPDVPSVDAGLYRGLNRILRFDAVPDAVTTTLLLPEAGQSRFLPPTIEDETFVLQVPGRTVVADEDETGTSPGLGQLRWGVVVRDEGSCDLLGSGRPTERLVDAADPAPASVRDDPGSATSARAAPVLVAGAIVLVGALAAYLVRRRVRNPR
jgi:hypothetical protein